MGSLPDRSPGEQPFPNAWKSQKAVIGKMLEDWIYTFEHEGSTKKSMSQQLRLNEELVLGWSKEVGGNLLLHVREFMEACSDYANGHGKLKRVYEKYEAVKWDLKR